MRMFKNIKYLFDSNVFRYHIKIIERSYPDKEKTVLQLNYLHDDYITPNKMSNCFIIR